MGNLARDVLRVTLYFLSADQKQKPIKSTDFPTCTHVRDKGHAAVYHMYLFGETVQVTCSVVK